MDHDGFLAAVSIHVSCSQRFSNFCNKLFISFIEYLPLLDANSIAKGSSWGINEICKAFGIIVGLSYVLIIHGER